MAYGFVYLLANGYMPNLYKIGFSMRHPRERVEELSKGTNCPFPFELLSFFDCEDPESVERQIHERFAQYRVSSNREFFLMPLVEIRDEFRCWANPCDGVFMCEELDIRVWREERDADQHFLERHFFSQNIDHIFWAKEFQGFE